MPQPSISPTHYPCPHCHQGHCICYDPGTPGEAARNARVYAVLVIRCPRYPVKEFVCMHDLSVHEAMEHPQPVMPKIGAVNGAVVTPQEGLP